MDYQTAISAACRTLTARGSLTLTTGYTYALSADDILSSGLRRACRAATCCWAARWARMGS